MGINKVRHSRTPYQGVLVNTVGFDIGDEIGTAIIVDIELRDGMDPVKQRTSVLAYLSTDAEGGDVTATAPSGGIVISTEGLAIPLVVGKAIQLFSDGDGKLNVKITQATAEDFYLVIVTADGLLHISPKIEFTA